MESKITQQIYEYNKTETDSQLASGYQGREGRVEKRQHTDRGLRGANYCVLNK